MKNKLIFMGVLMGALWLGGFLASPSQADVTNYHELEDALGHAEDNATVTIAPNTRLDLDGGRIDVYAHDVTLAGSANFNLGEAIATRAHEILGSVKDPLLVLNGNQLNNNLENLTDTLMNNLPSSSIYNSGAKAVTGLEAVNGEHSGISVPGGGFSLQNIAFSGTEVRAVRPDGYTNASAVYMGLIGPSLSRLPTELSGMNRLENVAFVNNIVDTDSNVNVISTGLFFTNLRFNPLSTPLANGSFPACDSSSTITCAVRQGTSTLDAIVSSVFYGNKIIVRDPLPVSSDAGNRPYSAGGVGWADIGIIEDSIWAENRTEGGAHHAFGGGLFANSLGTMKNTIFYNNLMTGDHEAMGGGLNIATIGEIIDSVFVGNQAIGVLREPVAPEGTYGGGMLSNEVGLISGSLFAYNQAYNTFDEEAVGGAIRGSIIGTIRDTVFYGNLAKSEEGEAAGGALAIYATNYSNRNINIINSLFLANVVEDEANEHGGAAIFVNVNASNASNPVPSNPYTLNLGAYSGGLTKIKGNTYNGIADGILIGTIGGIPVGRGIPALPGHASRDAVIDISAEADSQVIISDPIRVNLDRYQNGGSTFNFTFTLNSSGDGEFIWGGNNVLNASGGSDINLYNQVTLDKDFTLGSSNSSSINVDFTGKADLNLVFTERDPKLPFFQSLGFSNIPGASVTPRYFGFEDIDEVYLIANNSDLTALTPKLYENKDLGTKATIDLAYNNPNTIATLHYTSPAASVYKKAGPNAVRALPGINEAWKKTVTNLSADEQEFLFGEILGDIANATTEPFSALLSTTFNTTSATVTQAIATHNQSLKGGQARSAGDGDSGEFRIWANYIGTIIDQDTHEGYDGFESKFHGALVGGSYSPTPAWSVGLFLSIGDDKTDFDHLSTKLDTNVFQAGLFGQYRSETNGLNITADASLANLSTDSSRRFVNTIYDASYDQDVLGLGLEVGYKLNPWSGGSLTPFAGLRYQHLNQNDINETNSSALLQQFATHSLSTTADSLVSSLGVNLEHNIQAGSSRITPNLSLAWNHEFGDTEIPVSYRFGSGNVLVTSIAGNEKKDSFGFGAGLSVVPVVSDSLSVALKAGYNGKVSSHRLEHNFFGGLEVTF